MINEWSVKITRKPLFRLSILHTGGRSRYVDRIAILIIQTFSIMNDTMKILTTTIFHKCPRRAKKRSRPFDHPLQLSYYTD